MQPARHKLLARSVFTRDQYAGLAGGDLVDELADVFDLGRNADNPSGLCRACSAAAFRSCRRGCRGGRVVEGLLDRLQQMVHVYGFGEKVLGAVAHGAHGRIDRCVVREGDEGNSPVGNPAGRIGEDHVKGDLFAQFRGLGIVFGRFGGESLVFETFAQNVSHAF